MELMRSPLWFAIETIEAVAALNKPCGSVDLADKLR
jgi:hypothetical protein